VSSVALSSLSTLLHGMIGEGLPPLVHASNTRKLDGRPAGVTEMMSTDSGVPPQAHAVIQGFLVDGINGGVEPPLLLCRRASLHVHSGASW